MTDDEPKAPPRVILISHRLWQRAFAGEPQVIGRVVRLDGEARTIVGVMPRDFRFPFAVRSLAADGPLLRPDQRSRLAGRPGDRALQSRCVSLAQAQAEMRADRGTARAKISRRRITKSAAPCVTFAPPLPGDVRSSLVLLLARVRRHSPARVPECEPTAPDPRDHASEHELAVRSALGASRAQFGAPTISRRARSSLSSVRRPGSRSRFWLRRPDSAAHSGGAAVLDPVRCERTSCSVATVLLVGHRSAPRRVVASVERNAGRGNRPR